MLALPCQTPSAASPSWTSPATVSSSGEGRPPRVISASIGAVIAHVRTAEDAAQKLASEFDDEPDCT